MRGFSADILNKARTKMKIFETEECTGCKTCKIACSYHHRQIFCASVSSIEVIPREKDLGFAVGLHEKGENGHLACDGCGNEAEPFCVRYCPAIARSEISSIVKKFQSALIT
jgi:Fe-S-cluster-containing hydrogenase component 2